MGELNKTETKSECSRQLQSPPSPSPEHKPSGSAVKQHQRPAKEHSCLTLECWLKHRICQISLFTMAPMRESQPLKLLGEQVLEQQVWPKQHKAGALKTQINLALVLQNPLDLRTLVMGVGEKTLDVTLFAEAMRYPKANTS